MRIKATLRLNNKTSSNEFLRKIREFESTNMSINIHGKNVRFEVWGKLPEGFIDYILEFTEVDTMELQIGDSLALVGDQIESENEADVSESGVEPKNEADVSESGIESENEADVSETNVELETEADVSKINVVAETEADIPETNVESENQSDVSETNVEAKTEADVSETGIDAGTEAYATEINEVKKRSVHKKEIKMESLTKEKLDKLAEDSSDFDDFLNNVCLNIHFSDKSRKFSHYVIKHVAKFGEIKSSSIERYLMDADDFPRNEKFNFFNSFQLMSHFIKGAFDDEKANAIPFLNEVIKYQTFSKFNLERCKKWYENDYILKITEALKEIDTLEEKVKYLSETFKTSVSKEEFLKIVRNEKFEGNRTKSREERINRMNIAHSINDYLNVNGINFDNPISFSDFWEFTSLKKCWD